MSKILVTGASGNVGNYVVKELLNLGQTVVCGGSSTQKLYEMFNGKTENVLFDFTKPETFDISLNGVDRVFLMRPPHLGKPQDLYPFIDKMKEKDIKLVTFLSLMGVEKNTIPPHHKIEKYIEVKGLPYAHVRPGFFMQNMSGIHSVEIREKDEIFVPAGKSRTSFIDAADIGEAIAILIQNPEKYKNTYHTITGPEALDYYQVADILTRVCHRQINYAKPGYLKYRSYYIKNRGLDKAYVNVTVMLYFMTRLGTAEAVTNGFKDLTGRTPRTFEQFAIDNITAFRR